MIDGRRIRNASRPVEKREMRNTQGRFKLPPDVSFRKQRLSYGWAYVFRHAQLGEGEWVDPPPRPPEPRKKIASKLMQCETCGAGVALLIFADQATDRSGLEDYARLMYPKIAELDVPTWVIGPSVGNEPPPERPADILKIWPEREFMGRLRPDEFNPLIEKLATTHCR